MYSFWVNLIEEYGNSGLNMATFGKLMDCNIAAYICVCVCVCVCNFANVCSLFLVWTSFISFIPILPSKCAMLLIYAVPEWRFKEESITLLMGSVRIRLWHNEDASFLLHSIWVLSWKDFQDSFLVTSLWARLFDLLGWMYRSEYLPVNSPCSCVSQSMSSGLSVGVCK